MSKNNHYFIGYLLDKDVARKLDKSRTFLMSKVQQTGKVINYHTRFAYLGYMNEETFLELNEKLTNVLTSVTDKFGPQMCRYTNYDVLGEKTTYRKVAVIYENDNIENIIVPYIRHFTDKALDYEPAPFVPHINLFNINAEDEYKLTKPDRSGKSPIEKAYLPSPDTFQVKSIDILRGIPIKTSPGRQSKDDTMDILKVSSYKLRGDL